VLQSSLLPQAIGFIYPVIKDTHLPPQAIDFFYRHKRLKTETRSYRHKRLGLKMLHLPRRNSNHLRQLKKSLAAVKNERFYCHKRLAHLTATSEVRAVIPNSK